MHRINCPWCGLRDEAEFQYQGDATKKRPAMDGTVEEYFDYVYLRENPRGWHTEWWHHVQGCRQWVKVVRNTLTHEIAATGNAQDDLPLPADNSNSSQVRPS